MPDQEPTSIASETDQRSESVDARSGQSAAASLGKNKEKTYFTALVFSSVFIVVSLVVYIKVSTPDTRPAVTNPSPVGESHEVEPPIAAGTASNESPSPIGKWRVTEGTSKFDDSKTVELFLRAENNFDMSLCIRCKEGKTEAYVNLGSVFNQAELEFGEYGSVAGATVRMRLDQAKARTFVMERSSSNTALFFGNPTQFVRSLTKRNRMEFEYHVFHSGVEQATFDLAGLSEALKPLQSACRWK